ncbi:MAG: T9SS type A sorting domain-containing protein [Saprospirales bacterium]|nr:T9SS type A sorting domain-containing protein [Saprospirales bacterium]
MTRLLAILFFILSLFSGFSCEKLARRQAPDALQRKSEPFDQFSFQRSFPDRDFDWRGWRKRMTALRAGFDKTFAENALAENGAAADWTLQGPGNVAGRVNTLAIHPDNEDIVLAGFSAGGIFKTTNGGMSWTPVFDANLDLSIGDITFDPNNPDIVYAGTGDPNMPAIVFNGNGVYKSVDGGETWSYLGLSQEGILSKVLVDPSNSSILYVSAMGNPYVRDANRGVFKSTDGGLSWQKILFVSNQAGASDLVMHPSDPQILYASFWDRIRNNQESIIHGPNARIYKTTNGGATWVPLDGGLPTGIMGRTGLAISQQNPDKLYAVYIDSLATPGGLFKTEDGGLSWTSLNILALEDACGNFGWYFGKIRLNPVNDEELYFLGIVLWRKAAGSTQWQVAANSHADIHDLQFTASGRRYLGCDGGVYRNNSGQMAWIKSNNLPTTQFYHTSFNLHEPDNYYAGAQDNGIRKGNGNLYNGWASVFPADGFRCAFHPDDPNTFWVETQNGEIHKTTDGGNTWQFGTPCLGTSDRCNWDLPYFMSPHQAGRLYAGTYRVYFAENGSGWGVISEDLTDGVIFGNRFHTISCLDESPVQAGKLLAGTSDGNVWRREPAGSWFNITAGLPNRYVTAVIASPSLPNRLFVTHSGFRDNEYIPHIHRSDNNGTTWTDISASMPNIPVNDLYVLPGHADSVLFAATDAGVCFSLNSGGQWQRLGISMPFVPVFDLERNPVRNELLAATYARGLWTFPIDSVFSLMPVTTVAVSGNITTENGEGIAMVRVCDQPWQATTANGTYEILSNAPCLNAGLYPKRDDNPLNGLSTFDLVLINKHILGLDTLESPYKIIAADANNSRSISTFDIVTLRRLILGLDTALINVDSWRFVPAGFTFPDPANPFLTIFPEGLSLNLPGPPQVADFTGLKVGDVNANAVAALRPPAEDRSGETWPLCLSDRFFEPGQQLRVVFHADWQMVAGAQFTVNFDSEKLNLQTIEPLASGLDPAHFSVQPGGRPCFTACFENLALWRPKKLNPVYQGKTALFCAVIETKSAGNLHDCLQLAHTPTPAVAFTPEGIALTPELFWEIPPAPDRIAVNLFPNPFGFGGIWVKTGKTAGTRRMFDGKGNMILQKNISMEQENVTAHSFPQKGVYWYEYRQGNQRSSGKIVIQGN